MSKISPTQKLKMIEFLEKEENKSMLSGFGHLMDADSINERWSKLTVILNFCGSGPQKTPVKWRKTFNEIKCAVKKKQRALIADSKSSLPLNKSELRLLKLFDKPVEAEPNIVAQELNTPANQQFIKVKLELDSEDYSKEPFSFINTSEEPRPKRRKVQNTVEVTKIHFDAMNNIVSALNKMADSQKAMSGKVIAVADEFLKTLKNINNYMERNK